MLALFEDILNRQAQCIYCGEISTPLIQAIVDQIEQNQVARNLSPSMKKRLAVVMIESLQNITKHATRINNDMAESVFAIHDRDTHVDVYTGNYIRKSESPDLEARVNHVNSLDNEGLMKLYVERMRSRDVLFNEKSNAGLGLIEMVRTTRENIACVFKAHNDDTNFCVLKFSMKKED
jgi:hypothetical protein